MPETISQRQHTVKLEEQTFDSSPNLPPRTAAGEAFNHLVVQILLLNSDLLAAGDALAAPAAQTSARWRVLAAVEERPLSVAQIARLWGLARQSVQRIADLLVRDGLAVYQENPSHRRAQLLVLTPKGRSTLCVIQSAQRDWANQLGAAIGEADLRKASAILARVQRVITEQQP